MKPNHYDNILTVLTELKETFPKYTLASHLATAIDGSKDLWGLTDQDLYNALFEYKLVASLDRQHTTSEIDRIIKDGLNLSTILEDEYEDDLYND